MIADKIKQVLNQLGKLNYDRVIFDGQWGIGKTKYVNDFVKANPENSCYVSLFGKKSLTDIIEEIYYKSLQADTKGKFKEFLSKSAKNIADVNLSYIGISLSIPLLADLYSKMYSELEEKESYVIIFDDMERKHDELGIKELLGLIDLLGNIKGVKIALVAYTEKFSSVDKDVFTEYKEKSIDRSYCIDKYFKDAPSSILGTDKWFPIKNIIELLKFSNLRTFQKTEKFIEEVLDVLGKGVYCDKFTKDDVYRMCFATVVYYDEHNSEKLLVDESIRESLKSESDTINYIYGYILNHTLDNMMSKNILFHIKNWYETGDYDINSIRKDIDLIKSFNYEKPLNHLSSQDEVLQAISKSKEFIYGIAGDESLEEIIQIITIGTTWSKIANVEFGIENLDLIKKIRPSILNHVNIEKTLYENEINEINVKRYFEEKHDQAYEIVAKVNEAIVYEYYNKLIDKIVECFKDKNFNSNHYLKKLMDSVISIRDYQDEIMVNIINKIKDNFYLFPISTGEINEEEWNWCLLNNVLIKNIENHWKKSGFYDEYGNYISKKANENNDFMLEQRVKMLKQEIRREFYY
ncbi:hypothetical protein QUF51_08080 [Bacillus pumilus]|nr:hypothetical protein [Bacillus pumilus]